MSNQTTYLRASLLWFGASISIAEILTGMLIAPIGWKLGIIAIITGHILGCILLFLTGLIGAQTKKNAMETVAIAFGKKGSAFFSLLNIIQLVGWTAVMIALGSFLLNIICLKLLHYDNANLWSIILGSFIAIWVLLGLKNTNKFNTFIVIALFIFTLIFCFDIFTPTLIHQINSSTISFGQAMELSIIMPLSWLPLISDYTKRAEKPKIFTFVSAIGYFLGSAFMYIIGLGATFFLQISDIKTLFINTNYWFLALIIIIFSTITTAYLDVYSTAESACSINPKINKKLITLCVCFLSTLIAILIPTNQYENFLYLIGAVFAPMTAILLTDYYIIKKINFDSNFNFKNFIIWIIGFIFYRLFYDLNTFVGNTIPVMIGISILCIFVHNFDKLVFKNAQK